MSGTVTDYLIANDDSDWHYYVRDSGDLADSFGPIGYPDEFTYERVWMRPVAASSLDESERDDPETVTRDERGRFQAVTYWLECGENTPGAEAWFGARYA